MTYAERSLFPSRFFGLAGSIAVHLAIGLVLLMPLRGPGGQRAKEKGSESVIVVELLPLPPAGSIAQGETPIERTHDARLHQGTPAGATVGPIAASPPAGLGVPPQGTATGANTSGREATDDTPAGARSASGSELQNFRSRLLRHIEQYRRYPEEARRASIEGVTQVHFVMDHDGRVISIWIESSSGSMLLDDAAVAAVMRAAPLPAPPATWPASVAVTLPIGYSLQ